MGLQLRDFLWRPLGHAVALTALAWVGVSQASAAALPAEGPTIRSGMASPSCGTTGTYNAATVACPYSVIGGDTFTVPLGVSQVMFDVYGAQGGGFSVGASTLSGGF